MSHRSSPKPPNVRAAGSRLPRPSLQRPSLQRPSVQRQSLGRRTFLRGALAGGATVAVGLPLLECMVNESGTALADGSAVPCRFGTFVWGGGVLHSSWVPDRTGMTWDLPASLAPFGEVHPDLRSYLTMATGYSHIGSSPGHIPARGITLSSSHHHEYVPQSAGPGYRRQEMPEPSIDVVIREQWAGLTPRDSVHVQITQASPYSGNSSWLRGGSAFNVPERSPAALYELLFGSGLPDEPPSGAGGDALLRLTTSLQASALDAVVQDTQSLQGRLGANDRVRLDDHLQGLRELELRVQAMEARLRDGETASPTCATAPDVPPTASEHREKAAVMSELLAFALSCGVTRVFSFEWSANQSELVYSELGISETHHNGITHDLGGRGSEQTRIVQLVMTSFAELADALRRRPELDGNLLDHTLVFGTSEHANAGSHNYSDHPLVFVGGAGGNIRRGLHHRGSGSRAHDALMTCVRAVGIGEGAVPVVGMAGRNDSRGSSLPDRTTRSPISELMTA